MERKIDSTQKSLTRKEYFFSVKQIVRNSCGKQNDIKPNGSLISEAIFI